MSDKTSRNDFIPTRLLKCCANVFSDIVARLANLSFSQGCFPSCFKAAIVTPLLKKQGLDASSPNNYRPISNLNNISKILERLFINRFQPHVVSSPNFNKLQSAYRKNHSTETALLATLDHVYRTVDDSAVTLLVALDLSAAFDSIDHSKLLDRLRTSFGVGGAVLKWLQSYLVARTQSVVVGDCCSDVTLLSCGVPQGSVLGPLLTCYSRCI